MRNVDVAIIGGGPAGLAAAIKAKEAGSDSVVVIERAEYLGGLLDQCIHNGFGLTYFGEDLTGPEYAQRFIQKAADSGVQLLLKTMVVKILPGLRLALSNERGYSHVSAKSIVLAMGCRERTRDALNIAGTRPAGILTAGAAQRYVNIHGYIPGKEVVILGSGDVGMIMARRLTLEGARVRAVVEVLPYVGGLIRNEVQCLHDFDIPLFLEHTVTSIQGEERVKSVTIAQVDRNWTPIKGTEKTLKCDTLLVSAGLIPENELSRMAGIMIDPVTGGPVVDDKMETSVPGIFAGGNVLHVNDLVDNVSSEGEIAGMNAANFARGKMISTKNRIQFISGENIRYVIPQNSSGDKDVVISLRVNEPARKVKFKVGNVLIRSFRSVVPNQIVHLTIPSEMLKESSGKIHELVINCEKGD
jgi:NADPH-dependent 2,4-dienoyl-CoA reductase/sulfur reductase-like enzyme